MRIGLRPASLPEPQARIVCAQTRNSALGRKNNDHQARSDISRLAAPCDGGAGGDLAYTLMLSPDFSQPDGLAVVDVDPKSPNCGKIVHR